ncbi:MAG: cyclopropane-fatty-acyl-phospholipid synthase family protein [Bacteroidota bacterium]|nr:cyclopropane-fatty-acyl-phospholipid synthase family protein [Candidatus Kapabacteria bacterium]MDW8221001.1 cyclopropane-fatty-acyl-phospholipid synthase family protein [Bacteroidota bacterium]
MTLSNTSALDYIVPKTASARARYKPGAKPSFAHFVEDYINQEVDIRGSFFDFMTKRNEYFSYRVTLHHIGFIVRRMIPEVLLHSKKQDERIVRAHYDRGNDFFRAFLGPRMVYTSGFFVDIENDTLELAQDRKMQMVCRKLHLKEGDRLLDIGCGWGTLVTYAAKHFGADATGVTIAREGYAWGMQQIAEHGVGDRARIWCMDYRDIPHQKFDKITCLEMAEHVGLRKFQRFIKQVYDLLDDNGKFYLQQAGLRANPGIFTAGEHWEDLIWGLFMNEYIFSGADASTPLAFLIRCLQNANFEVHTVENIGVHYSLTIRKWYDNWMDNEEYINSTYGVWWFRLWQIFLRWSIDIGAQGSSTCWSIVAHKNLNRVNRYEYIGALNLGERAAELAIPVAL